MLTFLLLNSGCGAYPSLKDPSSYSIDSEFTSIIKKFEEEQGKTVTIDVSFKTLDDSVVGLCLWYLNDNNKRVGLEINIDPEFWAIASDVEKEEVVFHELGHCILGRDHEETVLEEGIPKSIMFPYVFEWEYQNYRSYYVAELKNENTVLTDYMN